MRYGLNPKNKNTRWPFPMLHVFGGISERSDCGKVHSENLTMFEDVPEKMLFTVCELCTHSRPVLRDRLYKN